MLSLFRAYREKQREKNAIKERERQWQSFLVSVKENDVDAVERALVAKPIFRSRNNFHALHLALEVEYKDDEKNVIDILISQCHNKYVNQMVFNEVAAQGNMKLVKFFIKARRAYVNIDLAFEYLCYKHNPTAPQHLYNQRHKICRLLLQNGVDVHFKNRTALRWALFNQNVSLATYLVQKGGVDVNAKFGKRDDYAPNSCGHQLVRPLEIATGYNNLELIELLVSNGADIRADHDNALILAVENVGMNVIRPGHDTRLCPVFYSTASIEVIEYFLDRGADVNCQLGRPIRYAIRTGLDPYILKFLIKRGANPRYIVKEDIQHARFANKPPFFSMQLMQLMYEERHRPW